jgi:hypothetical protein
MKFRNNKTESVLVQIVNKKLNDQPKEMIWLMPGKEIDINPEYGQRLGLTMVIEPKLEVKAETSTIANKPVETKQEDKSKRGRPKK